MCRKIKLTLNEEGILSSSHPLQAKQQGEIKNNSSLFAGKINIDFSIDTKILGGLVVAWEHRVWDFSLRTKLKAMVKHAVG